MAKKRFKISVILCWVLVGLIFVMNVIQGILISSFTKKSTAESYAMDCTQITNAYSLAIANKISEYMNQMTFYSNADIVSTADDQQIITWLREHNGNRKTYFSSVMYAGKSGVGYNDIGETENVSNLDFYKEIMKNGKSSYIDNPVKDKNGKIVFHIACAAKLHWKILKTWLNISVLEKAAKPGLLLIMVQSLQT